MIDAQRYWVSEFHPAEPVDECKSQYLEVVEAFYYDALRAERDGLLSARDDLGASNRRLRETLEVALRHIDMAALRVSHPKDAALIERMGG